MQCLNPKGNRVKLKPRVKLNHNSFKTFVKSIDEFLIFVRRNVTSLYSWFSDIFKYKKSPWIYLFQIFG